MEKQSRIMAIGGFPKGFSYLFSSFSFILHRPRLYKYVLVPFLTNVAVFSLVVYFGLGFFDSLVSAYIPQDQAWYWNLLLYFLRFLAWLVTAILVFFSFAVIGNLIASPFNDLLSERTEELLSGGLDETPFSFVHFFTDAKRTVIEESKKMFFFVVGMGLLLPLHLLPGAGSIIYTVLSFLWAVFFLAVEYTGYMFSRKSKTFREQYRFIMGHKLLMLGFGTGIFCLLAIPFLQFFCIPLGVVGATRICLDAGFPFPEKSGGV